MLLRSSRAAELSIPLWFRAGRILLRSCPALQRWRPIPRDILRHPVHEQQARPACDERQAEETGVAQRLVERTRGIARQAAAERDDGGRKGEVRSREAAAGALQ